MSAPGRRISLTSSLLLGAGCILLAVVVALAAAAYHEARLLGYVTALSGLLLAAGLVAASLLARRTVRQIRRLEGQSARYQMLFECNPNPMWVYDRASLRFLAVNEAAVQRYGYSRDELLAMTIADIRPLEEVPRLLQDVAEGHQGLDFAGIWRHRTKSGEELAVEITSNDLELDGSPAVLVLARDVTRRQRAEEELRSAHDTLRAIVASAPVAIFSLDERGTVRSWNRAAEHILGWQGSEVIGGPLPGGLGALRSSTEPERQEGAGDPLGVQELTCRTKTGSTVAVRVRAGALHDASGAVTGSIVIAADATEVRRLEAQYRQAQKMEAVGRLAGGVAHDFNNLLTVILGEADMALAGSAADESARAAFSEIRNAGNRAADLTRQLLAFSRQQLVAPTVFAVNDLVVGLESMLRRLIREDIELSIRTGPQAGGVRADAGQIEQVLLNLVINARDAMPNGGLLVIETSRVELDVEYLQDHFDRNPGEHVLLAVSDSGEGMSEDVLSHAFEPFFTTKPTGKGTGLGLATCYGIVQQAGGSIELYSEPGVGTTVKVYLPRITAAPGHEATPRSAPAVRGGERILVVEDEPAVCEVTARMLSSLGYEVTTAPDADGALLLLGRVDQPVDLLLTDVVLPGMKGGELAQRARRLRPELKVLFASGYTRDVPAYQKLIEESAALVEKPFTAAALGRRVREVLDAS